MKAHGRGRQAHRPVSPRGGNRRPYGPACVRDRGHTEPTTSTLDVVERKKAGMVERDLDSIDPRTREGTRVDDVDTSGYDRFAAGMRAAHAAGSYEEFAAGKAAAHAVDDE